MTLGETIEYIMVRVQVARDAAWAMAPKWYQPELLLTEDEKDIIDNLQELDARKGLWEARVKKVLAGTYDAGQWGREGEALEFSFLGWGKFAATGDASLSAVVREGISGFYDDARAAAKGVIEKVSGAFAWAPVLLIVVGLVAVVLVLRLLGFRPTGAT